MKTFNEYKPNINSSSHIFKMPSFRGNLSSYIVFIICFALFVGYAVYTTANKRSTFENELVNIEKVVNTNIQETNKIFDNTIQVLRKIGSYKEDDIQQLVSNTKKRIFSKYEVANGNQNQGDNVYPPRREMINSIYTKYQATQKQLLEQGADPESLPNITKNQLSRMPIDKVKEMYDQMNSMFLADTKTEIKDQKKTNLTPLTVQYFDELYKQQEQEYEQAQKFINNSPYKNTDKSLISPYDEAGQEYLTALAVEPPAYLKSSLYQVFISQARVPLQNSHNMRGEALEFYKKYKDILTAKEVEKARVEQRKKELEAKLKAQEEEIEIAKLKKEKELQAKLQEVESQKANQSDNASNEELKKKEQELEAKKRELQQLEQSKSQQQPKQKVEQVNKPRPKPTPKPKNNDVPSW